MVPASLLRCGGTLECFLPCLRTSTTGSPFLLSKLVTNYVAHVVTLLVTYPVVDQFRSSLWDPFRLSCFLRGPRSQWVLFFCSCQNVIRTEDIRLHGRP